MSRGLGVTNYEITGTASGFVIKTGGGEGHYFVTGWAGGLAKKAGRPAVNPGLKIGKNRSGRVAMVHPPGSLKVEPYAGRVGVDGTSTGLIVEDS